MRRAFGIISFVIVSVMASAQTQQGEVKTRGRMENGVLKPGKGLAGATVYVTGRQAVRSEGDASRLSFPVTGQKFRIVKVLGAEHPDSKMTKETVLETRNKIEKESVE